MNRSVRMQAALGAIFVAATSMSLAQAPGQATYKAKCQMCHGATGQADTGMGKATKTLPLTDPTVSKLSEAEMVELTKSGKGKMQPFKGVLSDEEIKNAVTYYRSLK